MVKTTIVGGKRELIRIGVNGLRYSLRNQSPGALVTIRFSNAVALVVPYRKRYNDIIIKVQQVSTMLEAIKEYNDQFRLLDRINSEYYFFSYPLSESMPQGEINSSLYNFDQVSFVVNNRQDY